MLTMSRSWGSHRIPTISLSGMRVWWSAALIASKAITPFRSRAHMPRMTKWYAEWLTVSLMLRKKSSVQDQKMEYHQATQKSAASSTMRLRAQGPKLSVSKVLLWAHNRRHRSEELMTRTKQILIKLLNSEIFWNYKRSLTKTQLDKESILLPTLMIRKSSLLIQ